MSGGIVNVRELPVGARLVLTSGVEAVVVSNPGDGVWLFGRVVAADDPARIGEEDMIFAQDVVALRP